MGALILSILAVIGKILLALLLFLLILIFIILFVPIRYHVSGSKDAEHFDVTVRVTWLLRFIRFLFLFPEPGKPSLYILFWDFLNRKPKSKKKQKEKKSTETPDIVEIEMQDVQEAEVTETVSEANVDKPANAPSSDTEQNSEAEETKKSFIDTIKEIPDKLKSLKEKLSQTENKAEMLQQKITYYWDLLNEPDTKALLRKVKPAIIKAVKQILPRTIHVRAIVGLGEPDTTAQVYGIAECILQYINLDIEITPELNEKRIEGEFLIKGRLYLFVFVFEAIKLLLNKRLWKLIKKLKAGRKK